MMQFIPSQLATPARVLPIGGDIFYEPKYDGYRCQLWAKGGKFRLFTRGGLDWTHRLGRSLPSKIDDRHNAVLDGEICVLDKSERPDFGLLCKALSDESMPLSFYAFDLLACSGEDLTSLPLHVRKARLADVIASLAVEQVRLVEHTSDGQALSDRLRPLRWEGVMAKDRNAPYQAGMRSPAWRKIKFNQRQEFIIAGWRPDPNTGTLKSIVLATLDEAVLTLRGSVGSGFSVLQRKQLADLFSQSCPRPVRSPQSPGEIQLLPPMFVCEVEFLEMSSGGCVRGARFIGLREDKSAADVRHETFASD